MVILYTLRLIVSKGLDVLSVFALDVAFSDHFCFFFDAIDFPVKTSTVRTAKMFCPCKLWIFFLSTILHQSD